MEKKASRKSTWAHMQVLDNAQIATQECLKIEAFKLLKGLEKSLKFLLSKGKRGKFSLHKISKYLFIIILLRKMIFSAYTLKTTKCTRNHQK